MDVAVQTAAAVRVWARVWVCERAYPASPRSRSAPATHTLTPIYARQVHICTCVCLYMCLSTVKQQVCHHQRHWITPSSIMSRRADLRWPVGKDTHALPYIFMKGHLFTADRFFRSVSRVIYRPATPEGLYVWGQGGEELLTALQPCQQWTNASSYTHRRHQCSVPHPSRVSVMYGLPAVWQLHRFNSALISSFDWSHAPKVRKDCPSCVYFTLCRWRWQVLWCRSGGTY